MIMMVVISCYLAARFCTKPQVQYACCLYVAVCKYGHKTHATEQDTKHVALTSRKTSEDRNALVVRFVGLSIMKDWSRVWYARKTTFAQDIRHGNAGKHRTNMCCRSAEELKPIAVEKGVKAEAQPARGKKLTGKYWN